MLNLKVKEKKIKRQEKRYIVQLCFNWAGKSESKKKAEAKARETFIQKIKDLNSLHMQLHIEEINDQDEQENARAS
jgi:hypothetical protein